MPARSSSDSNFNFFDGLRGFSRVLCGLIRQGHSANLNGLDDRGRAGWFVENVNNTCQNQIRLVFVHFCADVGNFFLAVPQKARATTSAGSFRWREAEEVLFSSSTNARLASHTRRASFVWSAQWHAGCLLRLTRD